MKKIFILLLILILPSIETGCVYAVRYDGPYHGKVVDRETRAPIEGAVVLGTWGVYHFSPAGGSGTFYDAREAITDKNGEFTIKGQGLLVFGNVGHMSALIYKAGYTYYKTGWTTIKTGLYSSKEVKWEGEMPVFSLRKLSEEDRKKDVNGALIPSPGDARGEKVTHILREINKELIHRGFEPYKLEPSKAGGVK
jgi:hypothetical protein